MNEILELFVARAREVSIAEAAPRLGLTLKGGAAEQAMPCPRCDAELELLRAVFEALPDHPILMTEDPLLDGPRFAAVSWNWVLEFDAPDVFTKEEKAK